MLSAHRSGFHNCLMSPTIIVLSACLRMDTELGVAVSVFVYSEKSEGDRTHTWGSRFSGSKDGMRDRLPLPCVFPDRKLLIQWCREKSMSMSLSLLKRLTLVLKVELKSINRTWAYVVCGKNRDVGESVEEPDLLCHQRTCRNGNQTEDCP